MTVQGPSRVAHGTFTIERRYDASPARVFAAYADPVAFRRWFVDGKGFTIHEWTHDFRVGGRSGGRFRHGGEENDVWFNETRHLDIVPDLRIVIAYVMGRETPDGPVRNSVSLATTELVADGAGTRLIYTEQGAFLESADHIAMREHGCREMLEGLARDLEEHAR
ncbi:MAG: SRPBCC domain-containing protein [Brevundimonas sp.]|uniref:SRPBCC domain-containing protein n=1 Tax=Brevundimonas sp. TaxID=1871086 RepID=UPI00391ABFBD